MAKRPTPSSTRKKPASKRAPKAVSKAPSKPAPKSQGKAARAPKASPAKPSPAKAARKKASAKPAGLNPHHIAAISAAVVALLGPLALIRSITPSTPKPNRWIPHLQRPLLRSEHEPRRRSPLTRHPPR